MEQLCTICLTELTAFDLDDPEGLTCNECFAIMVEEQAFRAEADFDWLIDSEVDG